MRFSRSNSTFRSKPDHAEWQGKIYSRSGKSDKYPDLKKATGYGTGAGLGGWNCRHNFFPYIEGMPRAYSEEQLEKYNEKCIPYNGKMYNEYEASQIQRGIERKIRRWKRENIAMEAAGEDISESAAKIKEWQERQADFINQTGLKQQSVREQFVGYSRKQASKVTQEVKRQEKIKRANDDLQDLRERSIIRATGVLVKAPTVPEQLTPNEHATQRLIERNLTIDDAKEIVKSASVALKQRNGSQYTYYSDKGFVAIQTDGTISSVGELNDGGRKLIEVLRNNGIKDKK